MSTVSERARRELHQRAEETWGKEPADTLMSYLPPFGYPDVATKSDIDVLRAEMEAMEARIMAGIEARFAATQEKFAEVHEKIAEVHEKIAEVHEKIAEVHEKIAEVHAAIAEVHATIAKQSRWFVVALSGTVIAVSALPQVVERLLP